MSASGRGFPTAPYVGLYGSHSGDWRDLCARRFDELGIAWHDPSDPRWAAITHENGDQHQALIDELVAAEHRGLRRAACVVFHVGATVRYSPSLDSDDKGDPDLAFAARFELGFLAGCGVPTFLHVEGDVVGRNYLWAAIRPYGHMKRCQSLVEAVEEAVTFMTRHTSGSMRRTRPE